MAIGKVHSCLFLLSRLRRSLKLSCLFAAVLYNVDFYECHVSCVGHLADTPPWKDKCHYEATSTPGSLNLHGSLCAS